MNAAPMRGRLRQSVSVTALPDAVRVVGGIVEVSLPREWVEAEPLAWPLLRGEISGDAAASSSRALQSVVGLLDEHGVLERLEAAEEYRVADVRHWFDAVALDWYAEYYRHPLWQELRVGTLDRNRLLAWVIHNYHVSRVAGITDARCAVRFPRHDLRAALRANALEEYWHCDAFYFVHHPSLEISDDEVKTCVPLPATLSLEHTTLWMAEHDWLGHLLFAYFQESSIRFADDSRRFYSDVEQSYGITEFFGPWLAHLQLDLRHGHADVLGALLDSDLIVPARQVGTSVRNAWIAYRLLLASLDEVFRMPPSEDLTLRHPVRADALRTAATDLLAGYDLSPLGPSNTALALHECSVAAGLLRDAPSALARNIEQDLPFLRSRIGDALFRALGHATEHDEVVTFGAFGRSFREVTDSALYEAPSVRAIGLGNFLHEVSIHPRKLAYLLHHLLVAGTLPSLSAGAAETLLLRELLARYTVGPSERDQLLTLQVQLDELIEAWLHETPPAFKQGAVFGPIHASAETSAR